MQKMTQTLKPKLVALLKNGQTQNKTILFGERKVYF